MFALFYFFPPPHTTLPTPLRNNKSKKKLAKEEGIMSDHPLFKRGWPRGCQFMFSRGRKKENGEGDGDY
uniref:Uncharacterized protein n=1 Tax=Daphnia magna TaxID=35525 RepID=A0A0P6BEP2_9CRUS